MRIDERLIHGQVVVGWAAETKPDRIVVVDDAIAESAWEQELYVLGLPRSVNAKFLSVADARQQLDAWRDARENVVVLTRNSITMRELARGGLLRGEEVNVGGLHHAPGRRQVLPYVFLSAEEADALRELSDEGADVSARDLPGARRIPLAQLLQSRADS
jgi:mannose/fructose/N-acetylgalactosamine-specific phosphotransferase system component IIB